MLHHIKVCSARVLCALSLLAFGHSAGFAAEQTESLVQAYNRSGIELFETLASQPGNLVISPYSIGTAMAMALTGARGETEAEMARVLKIELPPAEVPDADQRLNASLTERFAKEGVKLSLANALHLTKYGALVADSYKKLLADKFGAELFSGSDLAAINQWVKQKTDGKIDEILTHLDPYSVCVLLNAVYFKARWDSPFNPKQTKPGTFHLSRDESVEVPMMRQAGRYRILRRRLSMPSSCLMPASKWR
jgi:serpin B